MLRWAIFLVLLLAVAGSTLSIESRAHGGTYRGPGGGLGPGGPGMPATPAPFGPGAGTGTGVGGGAGASTSGADSSGDLTSWQLWWSLNRDAYLNLRSTIARSGATTDEFLFGRDRTAVLRSSPRPVDSVVYGQVVPVVLAAIEKEQNPDVVTSALLALAKIGLPREKELSETLLRVLRAHLSSSNQEIAETAAVALGVLASTRTTDDLAHLALDDAEGRKLCTRSAVPYRTRAFAAYGLGLIGHQSASPDVRRFIVHALATVLSDDRTASRDLSTSAMIALGLVRIDGARSGAASDGALGAESPAGEGAPSAPIASASRAQELAWIQAYFQDKKREELVRAYAPVSLARLLPRDTSPSAYESIVSTLCAASEARREEPPAVRQSAVIALGLLGANSSDVIDRRTRQTLRRASEEGDRLARRLALIALARVGARDAKGATEPGPGLQEVRTLLLDTLARGSTQERPWAALAVGILEHMVVQSGGQPAAEVEDALLRALLQHSSPVEAGAYCLALGLQDGPRAGGTLLTVLEREKDEQVRAHAAVALGLAREVQGLDPLRTLLAESRYRPTLLRECAIGLGLLGDKSVGPALAGMLRSAQGLSARSAISNALGYVGDERSVEPLLALVKDRGEIEATRAFAIVGLGLICDKESLPWNSKIAADANYWLPPATLYDPTTSTGILDLL